MREDVEKFIGDLSEKDFVVFAGAGVPKPTGIPKWKDLLQALVRGQEVIKRKFLADGR